MELGLIGLGRMGLNMRRRLVRGGHRVVVYNRSPEPREVAAREGALATGSLEELAEKLAPARAVWLMLSPGEPTERTLAPERGYAHVGPHGAGHYVKMVHNAIEYGMLEAIGEGFEMLSASGFDLDLHRVASLWNQGSVVRSWLMELAERALAADPRLERIRGYVEDTGYGRWTVQEAVDRAVPVPAIALALMMRFRSRQEDSPSARLIAALREQFGGHAVRKA